MGRAGQRMRLAMALLPFLVGAAGAAEQGYIVETGSYPVRGGPGISSPVLGRIKVGEKVQILGRSSGWAQITTPQLNGWVVESGVGAQPPATASVGPLQERLSTLEGEMRGLQEEKKALQEENKALVEENGRLKEQSGALTKEAGGLRAAAAAIPRRERLWEMGLGGGLVIVGWLAGFALSRRRGSAGRFRIE